MQKFGFQRGGFPVTEEAGDTCLALPFVLRGVMTEEQVEYVSQALKAAVRT
jgi:dTDP-4-amino-4,6-dideoxygalactose transaminase